MLQTSKAFYTEGFSILVVLARSNMGVCPALWEKVLWDELEITRLFNRKNEMLRMSTIL